MNTILLGIVGALAFGVAMGVMYFFISKTKPKQEYYQNAAPSFARRDNPQKVSVIVAENETVKAELFLEISGKVRTEKDDVLAQIENLRGKLNNISDEIKVKD